MPGRYAKNKRDGNQADIAKGLRDAGCSVADVSMVPGGIGDLIVGLRGRTYLLEIKDPSQRWKLTAAEDAFIKAWRGHHAVVETLQEAIAAVNPGR